jgi:hypothetical protein
MIIIKNRKAFLTIEILISIIIIFTSIVTLSASAKYILRYNSKSNHYENLYITAQSIINTIQDVPTDTLLNPNQLSHLNLSKLNGFTIKINSKLIDKQTIYDFDEFGNIISTNKTTFLFKVILVITKNNISKTYTVYINKVQG